MKDVPYFPFFIGGKRKFVKTYRQQFMEFILARLWYHTVILIFFGEQEKHKKISKALWIKKPPHSCVMALLNRISLCRPPQGMLREGDPLFLSSLEIHLESPILSSLILLLL